MRKGKSCAEAVGYVYFTVRCGRSSAFLDLAAAGTSGSADGYAVFLDPYETTGCLHRYECSSDSGERGRVWGKTAHGILRTAAAAFREKKAIHFYDALEKSTQQSDIRPFSAEEWGIFLKAMESLFSLEQAREEQAFEGYLKQLDSCIYQEQEAKKEKRKVTLSITMMGAAMVLLLLL